MKHINQLIFLLLCSTMVANFSFAQMNYSKFKVDAQMKDTFSFAKNWDYSWEVFKDDSTGKFTKNSEEPLLPSDTSHLYYTANCNTNVQGGYKIRYCDAEKNKNTIALTLADGLPAYASEFYIYVRGDSFAFKPKTIYPLFMPGQKVSYQVTTQKLILNKSKYTAGDIIIGYIDAEFIDTVLLPKKGTQKHKLYLKGVIRTSLIGRL